MPPAMYKYILLAPAQLIFDLSCPAIKLECSKSALAPKNIKRDLQEADHNVAQTIQSITVFCLSHRQYKNIMINMIIRWNSFYILPPRKSFCSIN